LNRNFLNGSKKPEIPLSGALVREKARGICILNGVGLIACSGGWLSRFQKRYNISCHVFWSDEANNVRNGDVNE